RAGGAGRSRHLGIQLVLTAVLRRAVDRSLYPRAARATKHRASKLRQKRSRLSRWFQGLEQPKPSENHRGRRRRNSSLFLAEFIAQVLAKVVAYAVLKPSRKSRPTDCARRIQSALLIGLVI